MELRPIETAPRDETDVLLFGKASGGFRDRPPVVAGWFEKHTDLPGWYTYDEPDSPIDMVPTHWASLAESRRQAAASPTAEGGGDAR